MGLRQERQYKLLERVEKDPAVLIVNHHFGFKPGDQPFASAALSRWFEPSEPRSIEASKWLETARQDIAQLDEEADDMGWARPSHVSVAYAEAFVNELAKIDDLPLPSVFPDDDRSVSIQIEGYRFIVVLTCKEDKTGIYNVNHDEYMHEGIYRNMEIEQIPRSDFLRQVRCSLHPARHGKSRHS